MIIFIFDAVVGVYIFIKAVVFLFAMPRISDTAAASSHFAQDPERSLAIEMSGLVIRQETIY
jgi:hypothetical protein